MRRRSVITATLAAPLTGCSRNSEDTGPLDYLSLAWQQESVDANRALVAEWNRRNPRHPVRYVQGSWESVHDQLLTSFEGGEAPDIVHDEAGDLTDFAHGGYLADLSGLLPASLKQRIPRSTWDTASFAGGVYGVPFLQEPRVVVADRTLLESRGVRIPDAGKPWSWEEFEEAARELTHGRTYGVVWAMKEPVSQTVNLAMTTGGKVFRREGGKNVVRFGSAESYVAELVHRQVNTDRTAPRGGLAMSGSDALPGFFGGRYAMVPLNFSYRQQVLQQAPDGFDWVTLPLPAGPGGPEKGQIQGVSPQTLSIAQDTRRKRKAMEFIAFLTRPEPLTRLALADWLLPTAHEALRAGELNTPEHGWRTGTESAPRLRASPVLGVRGFTEWKDKAATPALQEYYSGTIGLAELREKLIVDGNRILARYQR